MGPYRPLKACSGCSGPKCADSTNPIVQNCGRPWAARVMYSTRLRASRRGRHGAARKPGAMGAGRARQACANPARQGPRHPCGTPAGQGPTSSHSVPRAGTSGRSPSPGVHMDAPARAGWAASHAVSCLDLSQRPATPRITTAPRACRWVVKKSFTTLDRPPQGVCAAQSLTLLWISPPRRWSTRRARLESEDGSECPCRLFHIGVINMAQDADDGEATVFLQPRHNDFRVAKLTSVAHAGELPRSQRRRMPT
jgi:hypothetical protein